MKRLLSFALAAMMLLCALSGLMAKVAAPQDDFYEYVNSGWLQSAKIPPGSYSISTFDELRQSVQEQIEGLLEKKYEPDDPFVKAQNYYGNMLNAKARNERGLKDIQPIIDAIAGAKTIREISKLNENIVFWSFSNLFVLAASPDTEDSARVVPFIMPPALSLEDSAEYSKPTEDGKKLRAITHEYNTALFMLAGDTKAVAQKKSERFFAFEKKLSENMDTRADSYALDYAQKATSRYTAKELNKLTKNLPVYEICDAVGMGEEDAYVVMDVDALMTLDALYTQENLEDIKLFLTRGLLAATTAYTSIAGEDAYYDYYCARNGIDKKPLPESIAYNALGKYPNNMIAEMVGKKYVETYFSAKTKKDVEKMTGEILSVYKERLKTTDWLSAQTRKKAIEKLDAMKVRIGYPSQWNDYSILELKSFAQGGSAAQNYMNVIVFNAKQEYAQIGVPRNKDGFGMPPQTINAYYDPSDNSINFPAGILQPPYYDPKVSREANLGGIGAVIAHEITHAFDSMGAQYDKHGNMTDWWTKKDKAEFEARTKKVADYYSSMEVFPGYFVNGELTIGEAVADLGAMACVLQLAEELESPNYEDLFESWARVWRIKITDEAQKEKLKTDPHPPNSTRVNGIVQQYEAFYKTYDVQKGDKMYLPPQNRLIVW